MIYATSGFPITPTNGASLPAATTAGIFVGGMGTVALITNKGAYLQFTVSQVPYILPVIATEVLATGTSATLLVGLVR